MRPPGYEPGELPTAPLRDIALFVSAKVLLFVGSAKYLCRYFQKNLAKGIMAGLADTFSTNYLHI